MNNTIENLNTPTDFSNTIHGTFIKLAEGENITP